MATPGEPDGCCPTGPQLQTSTNTPHAARKLVPSMQQDQHLTSSAEAFYMNTCRANVISSDEFIRAIYGKIDDLADIRAMLQEDKSLSGSGWRALYNSEKNSYLPSDSPLEEDKTFEGLTTIFERCSSAAGISMADCIVQLKVHGNASVNFPNGTRPDATIHLTKSCLPWRRDDITIDHADVCMYVQFKNKENKWNFDDDVSKLLWNVHHRFRCDPCCRFVYGLTIENATARFWHFNRVGVMVSEPFDIIKDADKLIHIFVSSARAKDPSDLGFDPSIRCIAVDPAAQRQYRIEVHDNKDEEQESIDGRQLYTFTTQRVIANYGAMDIRSRGTRVFEGIEGEKPNATPVVIKDVWVDSDREVEGTILENVRKALEDTPDDLQLFLEPFCHGCVLINGVKDLTQPLLKTIKTMLLYYSGKAASPPSTFENGRRYTSEGLVVEALPNLGLVAIDRRDDRRKHYRIVFKGKPGCPLVDVESCEEVFAALLGGVKALRALHRAGYIHRDLSPGNLLLVKDSEGKGRGVLIDLEYAKRFPCMSKEGHDDRMGTQGFMAVEVNARKFLFLPPRERHTLLLGKTRVSHWLPYRIAVPWFHNPLHDMESAWWIAVWTFCRRNRWANSSLFRDNTLRLRVLTIEGDFRDECTGVPEPVMALLEDWLTFVRDKYMELGKLVPDGSHLSFKYEEMFVTVIEIIKAIVAVIQQDSTLDTEELANSAGDFPNKRRKVEHGECNA